MLMGIVAQSFIASPSPGFGDVVFQCSFDGSDNATSAVDESDVGATLTFHGNSKLKTAQKKFGTASLNGSAVGDAVTAPFVTDYNIGDGDFTVEAFIRASSFSDNMHVMGVADDSTFEFRWRILVAASQMYFQYSLDGSSIFTPISFAHGMSTNTWYHIAASRYLGTLRFFIEGVLKQRVVVSSDFGVDTTSGLSIGGGWNLNKPFNGYIDEVRITRGAWYRSDDGFTIPMAEFSGPGVGIGALISQDAIIVGTGISKSTGTGVLAAQNSQVVGASGIIGSGDLVCQNASVDGDGEVWAETVAQTLNADSSGWSGFNIRQVLNAAVLSTSGSKFRVTLQSGSAANAVIDGLYGGHAAASGDAYDFDGTQVPITVGGTQSFTIPANSQVVSDKITYAFDETKNFIIAAHFSATSTVRGKTALGVNYNATFKSAANETSTANVSTYTGGSGNLRLVARIEVLVT